MATTLQQSRGGDGMAAAYTVPFNANVPDLRTMTKGALNVLDRDRDGFFLMVEGGAVDWAGHANQPGRATGTDDLRGAYLDNTDMARVIFRTMR